MQKTDLENELKQTKENVNKLKEINEGYKAAILKIHKGLDYVVDKNDEYVDVVNDVQAKYKELHDEYNKLYSKYSDFMDEQLDEVSQNTFGKMNKEVLHEESKSDE